MRNFKLLWASAIALALLLPNIVLADQTDPRLDDLFGQLRMVPNQEAADPILQDIWRTWHATDDLNAQRDMRYGIDAMNAGQFPVAVAVFTKLVEQQPKFSEAWNKRATAYYLMGHYEKSIADCIRVLDLEPRHFGALSVLGMIYSALDQPDVAIAWYTRALEVNPHLEGAKQAIARLQAVIDGRAI